MKFKELRERYIQMCKENGFGILGEEETQKILERMGGLSVKFIHRNPTGRGQTSPKTSREEEKSTE